MPYLQSLNFSLFGRQLLAPHRLRLCKSLEAGLELVELLPPRIQLFAHIIQPLAVFGLSFLNLLVEVELDLAELFKSGDEVVVEDTEVGERLRLRRTVLLLQNNSCE